jgi:hypothetical protein
MDEEDGRPGARSRQLGNSNAPTGVAPQSLFLPFCAPAFRFSRKWTASLVPAGAKAQNFNGRFFGTTKVMPFHELALTIMLRSNTP